MLRVYRRAFWFRYLLGAASWAIGQRSSAFVCCVDGGGEKDGGFATPRNLPAKSISVQAKISSHLFIL